MSRMKAFFWLVMLFNSEIIYSKILIITSAYNRPDFIEIQYKTFQKFLKDDFEFIVFCDAESEDMCIKIYTVCEQLGIFYIRVPQKIHDAPYLERKEGERFHKNSPAVRNSNVVQFALDTIGFYHNDIVAIFDSDLFLVRDFSIREYLQNNHIAGWMRNCCGKDKCVKNHPNIPGLQYAWIGLCFLNVPILPNKHTLNFNCGIINTISVDAGGYTYYYLHNNSELRKKNFDKKSLYDLLCDDCKNKAIGHPCRHTTELMREYGLNKDEIQLAQSFPVLDSRKIRNIEFFLHGTFIHYQAGSNYVGSSQGYHEKKTAIMNNFFNKILNNKIPDESMRFDRLI